jgi:hypothetical protein
MFRLPLILLAAVLLMTACGEDPAVFAPTPLAVQVDDLPVNSFEVTLSGAFEASYSGIAEMIYDPGLGYALYMRDETLNVSLVLPGEIQRGNFNIRSGLEVYDSANKIYAVGGLVTQQIPDDELPRFYATLSAGRLTLTQVAIFSGAFEFSATTENGEILFVSGRFREVQAEAVDAQ